MNNQLVFNRWFRNLYVTVSIIFMVVGSGVSSAADLESLKLSISRRVSKNIKNSIESHIVRLGREELPEVEVGVVPEFTKIKVSKNNKVTSVLRIKSLDVSVSLTGHLGIRFANYIEDYISDIYKKQGYQIGFDANNSKPTFHIQATIFQPQLSAVASWMVGAAFVLFWAMILMLFLAWYERFSFKSSMIKKCRSLIQKDVEQPRRDPSVGIFEEPKKNQKLSLENSILKLGSDKLATVCAEKIISKCELSSYSETIGVNSYIVPTTEMKKKPTPNFKPEVAEKVMDEVEQENQLALRENDSFKIDFQQVALVERFHSLPFEDALKELSRLDEKSRVSVMKKININPAIMNQLLSWEQ